MARILLIDIPLAKKNKFGPMLSKFGSRFPPLNIILLGTILNERGHEIKFVLEDESYRDICDKLNSFKPHIVGITCMTMSYYYLNEVIKIVRDISKDAHIITGGFHPSVFPKQVMEENPELLAAFIGEADKTFPLMVDMLAKKDFEHDQLKNIPSIIFRNSNGILYETDSTQLIENLDDLPFLNYELVNDFFKRFYPAFNRHFLPQPTVSLYVSRGCPFKCNFCGRRITGSRIRSHSIDYRIDLIKHLRRKYNIKSIIYTDELFTSKKKDILEFCERIQHEGLYDIHWVCSARADTIDNEISKALVHAGCKQVGLGLESGSQDILNNIEKNISIEKAILTLEACKKNNLGVFATFMLGCFGETIETLRETYNFIMKNPIDYIVLCYFTPMPGSVSYDIYSKYGNLLTTDFREFNTFSGLPFVPFSLTKEDIIYWRKKIYRDFYFRPKRIFRELKYITHLPSWKYVERMFFK